MKTRLLLLLLFAFSFGNAQVDVVNVSTVTGSSQGDAVGSSTAARFWGPQGIASNGNIAVTDSNNNKIKYIYSDNSTVLLAGSTQGFVNGTGAAARFNYPTGIARLMFNDFVVCDTGNNVIRKVTSSFPLGVTTTYAGTGVLGATDGHVTVAQFNQPFGIAVDTRNDDVYVADTYNHRIRKISAFTVSTFAGSTQGFADGTGTAAQFDTPMGLVVDSNGNVFVLDKARIRKITPAGVVTTFAGGATAGYLDGTGTAAQFANGLSGITIDANNNLYVTDTGNLRVRKITPAGVVTTLAGTGVFGSTDGDGSVATFSYFGGISYHIGGGPFTLNIADNNNNRIRKINAVTANVPTITAVSSSSITANTASINYTLNANNGATTSVINYGVSSGALSSQVTGFTASGNTNNSNSVGLSGLLSNTLYYYQIVATNVAGTTSSTVGSFTTIPIPAVGSPIAEYNFNNTYNNVYGNTPFGWSGGTSFVTGRDGVTPNGALNINGTGSIGVIPGLPYGASSRTVSLWVKTNVMNSGYNMIFSYGQESNSSAFGASYNASVCEMFGYGDNLSVASANTNNTWYHFVYTYDGTNAKIYKNGALLTTVAKTWNTLNNSNVFKLGIGVGNEYLFNGAIDDLKIYNYALNASQVGELYSNNTLSSSDFSQNNLEVALYPNPVNDLLNIETALEIQSIEIYNIQGQKVMSSNQKQINVSDLAAGVYMVRIQDADNNIATKKIVIK